MRPFATSLLLLVTLVPSTLAAQAPSPPEPAPAPSDETTQDGAPTGEAVAASAPPTSAGGDEPSTNPVVRALLVEAVAEYDAGRYAEAQALFRRAHALAPSARTLRGLGMAAFELRQYVTALRAFEEALRVTERPLTEAQRAHVEDLAARARVYVSSVVVRVTPFDAIVRIDGAEVSLDVDGRAVLDPGPHTFSFEHEGHRPQAIEVQLEPGTDREVSAVLVPLPPAPTPSASADDALPIAGATLGVIGLLSTGAAVTTGVIASNDAAQLRRECDVFVCSGELMAVRDEARDLALTADVLGVVGASLGAVGTTLVLIGALGSSRPSTTAHASCGPTGCTISMEGRW
ncbi:MAG: tetratricopeptide repeat protein [Sandaracinaceae bacterium]|nr:tetratricopeptide repeat protein [Sandaracinaceae bacterium]